VVLVTERSIDSLLHRRLFLRFRLFDELPVSAQVTAIRAKYEMGVLIFTQKLRLKGAALQRHRRASLRH
jgi:hypothetical protein